MQLSLKRIFSLTAVSTLLLFTQAHAGSKVKSHGQDQRALQAITKRNTEFSQAVAQQDLNALAAIYDENVIFQAPDYPTLRGRNAVLQYLGAQVQAGVVGIALTTEEIRPLRDVRNGYIEYEEIGSNVLTFANGFQVPGKYTVIWRFKKKHMKDPTVFRDAFSFSVPLP